MKKTKTSILSLLLALLMVLSAFPAYALEGDGTDEGMSDIFVQEGTTSPTEETQSDPPTEQKQSDTLDALSGDDETAGQTQPGQQPAEPASDGTGDDTQTSAPAEQQNADTATKPAEQTKDDPLTPSDPPAAETPDDGDTDPAGDPADPIADPIVETGDSEQTPDDTTGDPDDTTGDPDDTTGDPDDTTGDPDDTAGDPDDTAGDPDDTTGDPDDTTGDPDDTAEEPEDIFVDEEEVELLEGDEEEEDGEDGEEEDNEDGEEEDNEDGEEDGEGEQSKPETPSDPTADVESAAYWSELFRDLELTGDYAADLLAVAETQLGYAESQRNFVRDASGTHKGYTRYGAWYGDPYGDWCAMFISFCLHYAGIPETTMPRGARCSTWIAALTERGLYAKAKEHTPVPGDIIFFTGSSGVEHVGIVRSVETVRNEEKGTEITWVETIEGNSGNAVRIQRYQSTNRKILGYGMLPMSPAFSAHTELDGVVITVEADRGAFPEGATLSVSKVPQEAQAQVDEAVENERDETANVAVSYTFDIKILDSDGNELQPKGRNKVRVSFSMAEVRDEKLNTQVYHIAEQGEQMVAQSLEVQTEGDTATVETEGFSYYTVEFTYGDLQYVLEGDGVVRLTELLSAIGLEGEVTGCSVSNRELFAPVMGTEDGVKYVTVFNSEGLSTRPTNDPEGDVVYIASLRPFDTEEWMDVIVDGQTVRITVTDEIMNNGNTNVNIPGVTQGVNPTFASDIPVADIWIDESIVNSSAASRNSAQFIPGELMTTGSANYHAGFQVDTSGVTNTNGLAGYQGNHFIVFDSSKETLDGSVTVTKISDGSTVYQSRNYFPGVVGTYKWENAAVRMKDDGTEEYLDVYVEYSNPMITLETLPTATEVRSADDVYLGLFGGNMLSLGIRKISGGDTDYRYGLQIDVKPYVTDKSGNVVSGKFYFPMVDLDVDRNGNENFKNFYGANPDLANYDETLHSYSEQVRLSSGMAQNSSGDVLYIPGAAGDQLYRSQIEYLSSSGQYIVYPGSVNDGNTFYSGFMTLAENGSFSLTYNAASAYHIASIETNILSGTPNQRYNFRLRHTTETVPSTANPNPSGDTGGTISTTREGNHSGMLNDGQIIAAPGIIATAAGQTVTYTFKPNQGYGIRELWLWNDTVTTFSSLSSPEEQQAYEWASGTDRYNWDSSGGCWVKTAIGGATESNATVPADATNVFPTTGAMKGGQGRRIYEGDGTGDTYVVHDDDGDGIPDRYTYTFTNIGSDNAIHVVWGQTILEVSKRVSGSGAENDTFLFRIRAYGDRDNDGVTEYTDFTTDQAIANDPALAGRFNKADTDNWYTFTLQSDETMRLPPELMPVGYTWEVEELQYRPEDNEYGMNLNGWIPVPNTPDALRKTGTFTDASQTQYASFFNRREVDIPADRTLTVEKIWVDDTAAMRPKTVTMVIEKPAAVGVSAAAFKSAVTSTVTGSSVTGVKYGEKAAYEAAVAAGKTIRTAQISKGSGNVYFWADGNDVYFYSASEIYLTDSAKEMFKGFSSMTDISGLAHVHTDFVTNMNAMFQDCRLITNLGPLSGWNTANVTNMEKMFSMSSTGAGTNQQMSIQSLEPLRHWQTQNVTTMRWMFRGAGDGVNDVEPIAGWDVSRVTTFEAMFFRTSVGATSSVLEAWNVGGAYSGSGFNQMFDKAFVATTSNSGLLPAEIAQLPDWSKSPSSRTGSWNAQGTYTTGTSYRSSTTPTNMNDETAFWAANKPEKKTKTRYDVDPADENKWIYRFDVEPGSSWDVYELLGSDAAYYTTTAQYTDPSGTDRYTEPKSGEGVQTTPVTGAEAGSVTTLTNTRDKRLLTVRKTIAMTAQDYNALSPEDQDKIAFTFTLKLWAGAGTAVYDLPADYPGLGTTIEKIAAGQYRFTMKPSPIVTQSFELPMGVRYEVTESSLTGWHQVSSHYTRGRLTEPTVASFLNSQAELLEVVKFWEGDHIGRTAYTTRPTGAESLGITVTTLDSSTRWRVTDATPSEVYPTDTNNWDGVVAAFNGTAGNSTLDFRQPNGTAALSIMEAKLFHVESPAVTMGNYPDGWYVIDKVNESYYKVYPAENVPFEKTYTEPDSFIEGDNAARWAYGFNIPNGEQVLSVEETTLPGYYQKVETSVTEDGRTKYTITNTLDTRELTVTKQTTDGSYGEFNYGIRFFAESTTSDRHPIKIGHTQLIPYDDGAGNTVYEFEFMAERGVTTSSGKNIAGIHELNNGVLTSLPLSGLVRDKVTLAEAEGFLSVLTAPGGITVGAADGEHGMYFQTNMFLADFGLQWNGSGAYTVYVDQAASVVQGMANNGRRIDWYIIPTPGEGEQINIRTPYTLRTEHEVDPVTHEILAPSQLPAGVTGGNGTYYFTLTTGETIHFQNLPIGVSYEIVEYMTNGWDLVNEVNESGKLTDGAVESWHFNGAQYTTYAAASAAAKDAVTGSGPYTYKTVAYETRKEAEAAALAEITKDPYAPREAVFTNEREKGTVKITKSTVNNVAGTFSFRATLGTKVTQAEVTGATITPVYPGSVPSIGISSMTGPSTGDIPVTNRVRYTDHMEYTTSVGVCRIYTDGRVTLTPVGESAEQEVPVLNVFYPEEFTTTGGLNFKFTSVTDEDTGVRTTTLTVDTTVYEFTLENGESAVFTLPYWTQYIVEEQPQTGWKLVELIGDRNANLIVDGRIRTTGEMEYTFVNDLEPLSLTVSKTVTGNQGSRDKYFKFDIDIDTHAAVQRTLHLDMSNATRTFTGDMSGLPNAATVYPKTDIQADNSRDDEEDSMTYGSASETIRRNFEWFDGTYIYRYDADDGIWEQYSAADGSLVTDESVTVPSGAIRTFAHGQHILTDADGKASFTVYLQHGQSFTLRDLPFGTAYTVVEDPEDYRPETDITSGDLRTSDAGITDGDDIHIGMDNNTIGDTFLKEDTVIAFTNRKNGVIPTETFFSWFAAAPLLAIPIGYTLIRIFRGRRRREHEQ